MNEYNIQYYKNKFLLKYFRSILILGIIIIHLLVIMNNSFLYELFENSSLKFVILYAVFLLILFALFFKYIMKKLLKDNFLIMYNEYIDINHGEKIVYYKNINNLRYKTIEHKRMDLFSKYLYIQSKYKSLTLKYDNRRITMIVYDYKNHMTEAEKRNAETFMAFCKELSEMYEKYE